MNDAVAPSKGSEDGLAKGFLLEDFAIFPEQGEIVSPAGEATHIEDMHMKVLVEFARAPHQVLSTDHFMDTVWEGRVVEIGNLQGAIASLRRHLGCNARSPRFIKTHHTRGYELIVDVKPMQELVVPAEDWEPPPLAAYLKRQRLIIAGIAALCVAALASLLIFNLLDNSRPTIAVIPFGAPEDERLPLGGIGMADYLSQALTRADDLDVVSRGSSFAVLGTDLPPDKVAERLDADYLVSGELLFRGNDLRVILVVEDDRSIALSTDVLEGHAGDLQRLQERTLLALSDALGRELDVAPLTLAEVTYTIEDGARQKLLEAQYQWHLRGEVRINRAIELLEEAIALRPNFAEAHLALAQVLALRPIYAEPPEPLGPAYALARQALARVEALTDELDSEVAALRGSMAREEHNWQEALDQLQLALSLKPDNALAHYWYSYLLSYLGRYQEALHHAQEATRLDPYSAVLNNRLALAYVWVGEHQKAAQQFDHASELGRADGVKIGALTAARNGAWETIREMLILQGNDPLWVVPFVQALQDPAQKDAAVVAIERAIADDRIERTLHFPIWWMLADADRAIATFDSREKTQDIEIIWAEESRFLREHPGFDGLLASVGLTEFVPPPN